MKILIIMDPGILVPPIGYGGHERLVAMFAKEYHRLGHDVHLLVTSGSFIEGCTMHSFGKEGFPPKKVDALMAIPTAWVFLLKNSHHFDLVHNFGRLFYLLPIINSRIKKVMTYGREISRRNIGYVNKLPNKNIVFTGCSNNLVSRGDVSGKWKTVYNAINFKAYKLEHSVKTDAPLIFLGRIERVKGCHTAIAVAKATNHQLIIAGNISPLEDEQQYFQKEVLPHIDNEQIVYIGSVNDVQKNEFLGGAKALIMPIEWNEPFGIVMIEAMACGTPVIAFNKGSVSEVVDEGITGYKVDTIEEMNRAVQNVRLIERNGCRMQAEKRFDVKVIASQYLNLFDK